jgi:uncharacterized protein YebE (UPF0316 family)
MNFDLSPQALTLAAIIFGLRVLNQTFDTLRILMMMRGRKFFVWILGFLQSVVYIITLTSVLNDLDNVLNIIVYAAGFATGNVMGVWLEARLGIGFFNLRIISPKKGRHIVKALRAEGYAVTVIRARGRDGNVSLLNASVRRRDVEPIRQIVEDLDESAFITGEETRPIWRGFWRRSK